MYIIICESRLAAESTGDFVVLVARKGSATTNVFTTEKSRGEEKNVNVANLQSEELKGIGPKKF